MCKECEWRSACLRELKGCNDLTLLPELGRVKRDALMGQFTALEDLAHGNVERYIHSNKTEFPGVGPRTLRKFRARARLAVMPDPVPYLTRPVAWPVVEAELFFDIETDPMRDLCYLHGLVIRGNGNTAAEQFAGVFADGTTPESEREALAAAMAVFRVYPTAVVVHYAKYEHTEYRKLRGKYPDIATGEEAETLFSRPGRWTCT